MRCFRYKEDRIPVALLLTFFALHILVFLFVRSPWLLVLWSLAAIIPKGFVCAWNHHHQHVMTLRQPLLNRLLEIPYAFLTGISSHGWVLHHVVGHHVTYLDQQRDESRWQDRRGRKMGMLVYTLVTTWTAYPRCLMVARRHPRFLPVFLGMGLLNLVILAGLLAYNPLGALLVFVLPAALALHLTVWATYSHHAGLPTDSHFVASNNVLDPWYNWATLNLGYHTAHHYRQAVHWSLLPQLHATIAHRIPKERFLPAGVPFNVIYAVQRWLGKRPGPPQPPREGAVVSPVPWGNEHA